MTPTPTDAKANANTNTHATFTPCRVPPAHAAATAIAAAALAALAGCAAPRATTAPTPSAAPTAPAAPTAATAPAPAPAATSPARVGTDYRVDSHWLCRPGRDDSCAQPVTVAQPDGAIRTLRPDAAAPVDCFYVYPTISYDATGNSDLVAGPEERRVAQHQLAPFGGVCRMFAPMYRQVTLAALRSRFGGAPLAADPAMALGDVRDAWRHYLEHDNQGRGVVLIGHSQGARMLAELVAREIDGQPAQQRIVSALLLGTNIAVPKGADVGGAFRHMPLCRSAAQTGCVIAYTAFRADAPPPADSLFGRMGASAIGATDPAAYRVACTNPAALGGGRGTLQPLLPVRANLLGQPTTTGAWGAQTQAVTAAFVAPAHLSAECVEAGGASYLSVALGADVPADVVVNGQLQRNWGLHLVDSNLAAGNLADIVRQQARAYAATPRR
ncbi:DUF3089 domain-containing protein [Paracidovorax sp. MALMAid1276]|uniref:DUF3089 domain-containing protein n=1 Tax=Paracidovorax sp. MALMAid1276 TaxID=3411631 RepID=UPI003B98E963